MNLKVSNIGIYIIGKYIWVFFLSVMIQWVNYWGSASYFQFVQNFFLHHAPQELFAPNSLMK